MREHKLTGSNILQQCFFSVKVIELYVFEKRHKRGEFFSSLTHV